MDKRLVAGPWVGEFGWELMSWQGYLRKLSKGYDEVVVCGPSGHDVLYGDFCTEYIGFDTIARKSTWKASNVQNPMEVSKTRRHLDGMEGDRVRPERLIPINEQEFIRYGDPNREPPGSRFDVVVHARMRHDVNRHRNWPPERWEQLVERLASEGITVGAIGTEAYLPGMAKDLTNRRLRDTIHAISSSRLAIGPPSGPMHLASLCRTPHLVWACRKTRSVMNAPLRKRYKSLWNPLGTECFVLDHSGWRPSVDDVFLSCIRILS